MASMMIKQQKALDQSFKNDPCSIDENGDMRMALARVAAVLQVEAATAAALKAEEDGGEVIGGGTDFAARDGGNWRTQTTTPRRHSSSYWDEASGRRRRNGGFDERPTAMSTDDEMETLAAGDVDAKHGDRVSDAAADADAGGDAGWRTHTTTQRRRTSGYWDEASGRRHRAGALDERPSFGGIGL